MVGEWICGVPNNRFFELAAGFRLLPFAPALKLIGLSKKLVRSRKGNMFSIFKKKESPLLIVKADGKELCRVFLGDVPCEKNPSAKIEQNGTIEFVDAQGISHLHGAGLHSGWFHFSVRAHPNLACQSDCVITQSEKYDSEAFGRGDAIGIRFQPFFLSGAEIKNESLYGKGLFARGLHFSGTVTSGNVILSCECDHCKKSFQIRSYHAGFSNSGYFYSDSGKYTITVDDQVSGCPAALAVPNPLELAALEAALPVAPDGTRYRYTNPFRCPHCSTPYIDFSSNPNERPREYYGNYFVDSKLLRYEPVMDISS
ncbi:hypothetical protein SAMN04515620_1203 [Collimonas sp. OK607]|uniref:hypothetical protein n=1 Tax=Collimonas sp. OK607 TaxID=1798194 RepID=UPI0008E3AA81|nr:hypothetical protein [Collimonas sp. OK607]SFB13510.1 hypothetical protein SAMN04515620_1203 [Collimonas sp. OK607]